jgi:hypothetical protein
MEPQSTWETGVNIIESESLKYVNGYCNVPVSLYENPNRVA